MHGKRRFQNMEEMGGTQEMIKGKKDGGMEGKDLYITMGKYVFCESKG